MYFYTSNDFVRFLNNLVITVTTSLNVVDGNCQLLYVHIEESTVYDMLNNVLTTLLLLRRNLIISLRDNTN
jgi:hypothetical protein